MLILPKRYEAPLASRHTWAFHGCLAEKKEIEELAVDLD